MNTFLENLIDATNFGFTENHAVKHLTTKSAVLDLFALCGAYRNRSESDCILAFQNALVEDEVLALKCLFYLRDCRGGQGERRFFRVCFRWLADNHIKLARRNLVNISEYGRWDDLIYATVGTLLEKDGLELVYNQFKLDLDCKTPSLLGKWLPSENASARETKEMANIVRTYFGMSHKDYRKALSELRSRINIVEKLMSQNRWDEIEFDKIPSRAGLIYKNAFARRDMIAKKYETFAKDSNTKVNADTLYPYDIAHKAFYEGRNLPVKDAKRLMIQKYWDNLPNYYGEKQENAIAVVDVSGSMDGRPMEAAVSLGAYIAERGKGPFANHFITFSSEPSLVPFEGIDIVDKFNRAKNADWGMSTNIEAVFDLLLSTAKKNKVEQDSLPERLYIFSDMEFNACIRSNYSRERIRDIGSLNTLLENIAKEWADAGYELPKVIFWNLNARTQNIPALGGRFSYVSGLSPVMIETILSGKDGWDLMIAKLLSERYEAVK